MPGKEATDSTKDAKKDSTQETERREKLQDEVRRAAQVQPSVCEQGAGGAPVEGLPVVELVDDPTKFKDMVNNAKSKIDTDNDGVFSDAEVSAAMNNRDLKGSDAQVASALKRLKDALSEMKPDGGLTMADIETTQEMINRNKSGSGTKEDKAISDRVEGTLQATKKSLDAANTANYQLFNSQNPLDSITPEAAKQGNIGDCYFIAALSSMAATQDGKEQIQKMIKDNGDGTYTVTFPGDPDHPMTITRPTDAQLATYAKADNNGIWAAVLEKAYAEYCGPGIIGRVLGEDSPQDNIGYGALTDSALRLLTGKSTESIDIDDQEKTAKTLEEALSCGEAVTIRRAGSISELVGLSEEDKEIPRGHKYSIIGYDAETKMVTVRNPWGHGEPMDKDGKPKDGKDDGIYQIPLSELPKYYDEMSVTRRAA